MKEPDENKPFISTEDRRALRKELDRLKLDLIIGSLTLLLGAAIWAPVIILSRYDNFIAMALGSLLIASGLYGLIKGILKRIKK